MARLTLPNPPKSANERTLAGFTLDGPFTGLTGTTVTLTAPATVGLVLLWKNGLLLTPVSGYTIGSDGKTITLAGAAITTDVFIAQYWARGAQ